MSEIGIDIVEQTSQVIDNFNSKDFDVVASMCGSGFLLPEEWLMVEEFQEWQIPDPEDNSIETYRQVREQVKQQVESLLIFLRLKISINS